MLKIYNSLTRQKEVFEPIEKNKVRLYICGVTVYDHCHLGHARTYTAFDVIVRYFKYLNYEVTYVRNITDIDDKIIKRAAESGEKIEAIVARFSDLMHQEFATLGLLTPDFEPKATETIDEIQAMITKLIHSGHAYHVPEGDVYYDVSSFKTYGKLSQQNLAGLQAGIRVEVAEHKKNPLDFVLWKPAKPGEPAWDSSWGRGGPGWHIECSAMAKKILGATFDIHGGGSDLKFPHHENEIAQSEAANLCELAHYWLHTGMVQVNQEKMSKSLKNFFSIHEVLAQYPAEVVRYFLISGHYRSEINYSDENLQLAKGAVDRFYYALRGVQLAPYNNEDTFISYIKKFQDAMDDDFNTPEALAVLADLTKTINRNKKHMELINTGQYAQLLIDLAAILGIAQQDPEKYLAGGVSVEEVNAIERLINNREQARREKNFKESDRIRAELKAKNIILEDTPTGTEWRKS
jgi:cysteinyl-tRNA synthetase